MSSLVLGAKTKLIFFFFFWNKVASDWNEQRNHFTYKVFSLESTTLTTTTETYQVPASRIQKLGKNTLYAGDWNLCQYSTCQMVEKDHTMYCKSVLKEKLRRSLDEEEGAVLSNQLIL